MSKRVFKGFDFAGEVDARIEVSGSTISCNKDQLSYLKINVVLVSEISSGSG